MIIDSKFKNATIMIVDDEPENLRVLGTLLSDQDYTVRSFTSGKTALESARSDPPNIFLIDIRMPGMDGYELCSHLKATDHLKNRPILFLSAIDEVKGKIKAFELGCADYITKPFHPEEVLARLQTHLELYQNRKSLKSLNEVLEDRVQERTAELIETNKNLMEEIKSRRSAEHGLQKSEEKYRRIVRTANEGIITADKNFKITYANQMAMDLLKCPHEQIIGKQALDFIFDDDRALMEEQFKDRMAGKPGTYECKIRCQDETYVWVIVAASPILDTMGKFQGSVVMLTDITERKASENGLKKALEELSQLKERIEADCIYLQEEIKLEHNFEEIIGSSDALRYVLYRVEQVATTDSTVLIFGETGTGKELIARAIHSRSDLSRKPLIKVNCTAIPETLTESELFGHIKGAFTGAVSNRQGRFELAHKGTLFLDEIGDLPLSAQGKLLRVLETGEYERLGDNRTRHTDVRLIAATNRDLEKRVNQGKFREDLWYRLNIFPVSIPPLRDRLEDIPLLVNHFINLYAKMLDKERLPINRKTMAILKSHTWPGNVRELKHLIERSVIISERDQFVLPDKLINKKKKEEHRSLLSLHEVEKDHISKVLETTHWVIEGPQGAASVLGLHPNTLRYRLQKLGLKRPPK